MVWYGMVGYGMVWYGMIVPIPGQYTTPGYAGAPVEMSHSHGPHRLISRHILQATVY